MKTITIISLQAILPMMLTLAVIATILIVPPSAMGQAGAPGNGKGAATPKPKTGAA